jgi:hypothetical protein
MVAPSVINNSSRGRGLGFTGVATNAGKSEEEKEGTKVEPRSRANKQKERNISVRVDLDAIPKGEGDFIVHSGRSGKLPIEKVQGGGLRRHEQSRGSINADGRFSALNKHGTRYTDLPPLRKRRNGLTMRRATIIHNNWGIIGSIFWPHGI